MTREQFEALIETINSSKIATIHYVDECENWPSDAIHVARDLNIERHRWYEISTTVYKIGEWYLGVTGPSELYSEEMSWSDVDDYISTCEMMPVEGITYVAK